MDGKHAARRRIPWPVLPVTAGLVVAAVAAGTVSLTLSGNDSPHSGGVAAAAGAPDRNSMEHRASRGKPRSTTSHSASPSPSASSDSSDNGDTQSADVGQSGQCMAGYVDTGSVTASGAKFNPNIAAGANMDLPFGTKVRITNSETGKSVEITINDRGPYSSDRCFDLTSSAYKQIASLADPEVQIDYEVLS